MKKFLPLIILMLLGSFLIAGDYVDVTDYGAVGDGTTDDGNSIRSAIAVGGEIFFPPGTYRITDLLKFPEDVVPVFAPDASLSLDTYNISSATGGWVYFEHPTYDILPEWFGAVGDGSTNDYDALQRAVDSLIDPSIDPIGQTANPNHASYNAGAIKISGGKEYYIGGNTILLRSEHHFLGVKIYSDSTHYAGGIIGNGTMPLIYVKKALNVSDDGAHTNKVFDGLTLCDGTIGIEFEERGDQSLYIQNCRFVTFSSAAIKGYKVFHLNVLNNYFGDCGAGWFVYLTSVNNCKIIGNIAGESSYPTKGICVQSGSIGGNIISGNILSGGQIVADASATISATGVTITGNVLHSPHAAVYGAAIFAGNNLRNVSISNNDINSPNGTIDGIRLYSGTVRGNRINGAVAKGIDIYRSAVVAGNVVDGAGIGIFNDYSTITGSETMISNNMVKNCTTYGVQLDNYYITISDNWFSGNAVAIKGNANYRYGLISGNVFKGNTTDCDLYYPAWREGEYVQLSNNVMADSSNVRKVRSGRYDKALVMGDMSSAPTNGTWAVGDTVLYASPTANGKCGAVCITGGSPGTWKEFGQVDP